MQVGEDVGEEFFFFLVTVDTVVQAEAGKGIQMESVAILVDASGRLRLAFL